MITKNHPERQSQIIAIANWKATPPSLRQHRSLKALCLAHNWPYHYGIAHLAESSEVYHLMLTSCAGEALDEAPEILRALAQRAKEGNVKAAQVYLDFVRQTITDEGLLTRLQPHVNVTSILERTAKAAEALLQLADVLGDNPDLARERLKRMTEDAEFTIVPDGNTEAGAPATPPCVPVKSLPPTASE